MTYLLIIILTTTSGTDRQVRPMPTAAECVAAMEAAQTEAKKLPGPWTIKTRCEPQ